MKTDIFSIEGQVKSLCEVALQRGAINERSIMGIAIKKTIPNFSISEGIEAILQPEYMNTVYTWFQVQEALKKVHFI